MPDQQLPPCDSLPTHVDALATVLDAPCPCDRCIVANDCGTRRLACAAFENYVAGASETRWRAMEREPTHERWGKLFEPEALKGSAAILRQLAKRSRRTILTAEQRRERWRLASRMRRAKRRNAAQG